MEALNAELRSQSDVALHEHVVSSMYRVATAHALEKQARYEKKINFFVLERTQGCRSASKGM